ncbi:hypothetical protein [Streptomyces huasconensis]|uniref:hypothetical protein n=1 Tax=Streptomyces huasconensis TaxID=1854574 RepID=UPI0037028417
MAAERMVVEEMAAEQMAAGHRTERSGARTRGRRARVSQQSRAARLAASALSLVVTVLALFAPSAATAYGTPAPEPLTHHTVAAHAGKQTGPEDVPALRVAAHRLDTHLPAPHLAGPARTASDPAPHRATGGPATHPTAPRIRAHQAADPAAPRAPPHR